MIMSITMDKYSILQEFREAEVLVAQSETSERQSEVPSRYYNPIPSRKHNTNILSLVMEKHTNNLKYDSEVFFIKSNTCAIEWCEENINKDYWMCESGPFLNTCFYIVDGVNIIAFKLRWI